MVPFGRACLALSRTLAFACNDDCSPSNTVTSDIGLRAQRILSHGDSAMHHVFVYDETSIPEKDQAVGRSAALSCHFLFLDGLARSFRTLVK